MEKLVIRELSKATSVSGQGVGSAYLEMVSLCKEIPSLTILEEKDKGKADIYHVHTVNPSFKGKMGKKTVNVCYVHFLPTTLDGSIKLPKFAFNIFKKYVISFYKKADEIVVVNPIFIPKLIELGIKEENITFIPNYVDHDAFKAVSKEERTALRKQYGLEDKFTVLGCGQIQTRKGVKEFIEVAKDNPDIQFVWAGGFSFGRITDGYSELKKIVENHPDNVFFPGIVQRSKMNEVYNLADIFFLPSTDELMPMSILEAANLHIPLLVRDLPLYECIFFDHVNKQKDVEGWNKQIREMKDNVDKYTYWVNHSKQIAEYYSKERVKQLWVEYYPRIYAKWLNNPKKKLRRIDL